MPKPEKFLMQIRLSDADRRRIKSLAAKQGLTLQDAVVEAFEAWDEKLRTERRSPRPAASNEVQRAVVPPPPRPAWLKQALKLDWTKCPEVELADDGVNHLWILRDSEAPLNIVLEAVADGIPVAEIAEAFQLQPLRLAKVLEFAAAAYVSNALN